MTEKITDVRLAEMLGAWEAQSEHARLGHGINLHELEMVSVLTELQERRRTDNSGCSQVAWDELARDQARSKASDLLKSKGWKPGDNFSVSAMLSLMVEFSAQAHTITDRCGFPDCGCDFDALCDPVQAQAEVVPVAWRWQFENGGWLFQTDKPILVDDAQPLYASQPKAEVTDEEIERGARALFEADVPNDNWDKFGAKDFWPEKYRNKARIVLTAALQVKP